MLTDLARSVLDLIYPPVCRLCDRLLAARADFCPDCRRELLSDPFRSCQRCGATVGPHVDVTAGCFQCRDERFAFDNVLRVGPYAGLRRDLVLRAKTDESVAEAAGAIFAEGIGCKLAGVQVDGVIGIPLHWHRGWRRQYNQSAILARMLAAATGLKLLSKSLRRIRPTPLQTSLSGSARRLNVRGAFRARHKGLQGKSILVTDDVMTTGATADAAAKALRDAGAKRVVVAVLSHG
jgi:ComF family protein